MLLKEEWAIEWREGSMLSMQIYNSKGRKFWYIQA